MKKAIIIIIVIFGLLLSGCIEIRTDGEHTGQVTAIEKTGLIWKTWTVYFKTDIASSQEDRYCVEDQTLIPILKEYSKNKTMVTIYYNGEIRPIWRCGEIDKITGVEIK